MASNPAVKHARRSLIALLVIIAALVGVISIGVVRGETTWVPKLGLDLQGGTQVILAPQQTSGASVTPEQLNQAVAIIRQRVDASGVSEAEISTQGNQNIIVSIPGKADDATLQRIEASAKLEFRPVLMTGDGTPNTDKSTKPADTKTDASKIDPSPLPKTAYDAAWLTDGLKAKFEAFECTKDSTAGLSTAPADRPLITCESDPTTPIKYILGPVEMGGDTITDATAQLSTDRNGSTTGEWVVQMKLNGAGTKTFGQISQRMFGATPPLNQFAFVLDGQVLSAPTMNAQILDGRPSISGNFTQESAKTLADQLKFGALPISFTVQSQEDISATLGSNQLQAGLLAGLIGLLLVVIYSMFQYRALGSLTVMSLVIAAVLTYLVLTLLSWRQGYRLSLAGVAGVIVAVGITADSFIVYFERIRDALRDGLSLEGSVERGWKQAIRTVLASDGINFLAAAILFIFAVGSVRGFAYTLGITTLIDVLVVVLFTHPMMALLARTRFYRDGHRFSGLDPRQLGAAYRGRAQFREPVVAKRGAGKKVAGSAKEAQRRQTIAERKAAEASGTAVEASNTTGKES